MTNIQLISFRHLLHSLPAYSRLSRMETLQRPIDDAAVEQTASDAVPVAFGIAETNGDCDDDDDVVVVVVAVADVRSNRRLETIFVGIVAK